MKAQKWILAKHFEGVPKDSDLELVDEDLSGLNEGGENIFEYTWFMFGFVFCLCLWL